MGKAEFVVLLGTLFISICVSALIIGFVVEIVEDIILFFKKRRAK